MHYSEEQQAAIDLCSDISKRVVGVTGEAGTGKTTILKAVYDSLQDMGAICLCAPTGRAAKRISEATGYPAKTIHRMMRYSMPEDDEEHGLPAHDRSNPLPYKFVLVDEASMVNDDLYRSVLDALPRGACVRFFGDANQLPPVQGISPFLRILSQFPSAKLTHNYRSDDGVVSAARQILTGRIPQPNAQFRMINPGRDNLFPTIDEIVNSTFRDLDNQIIVAQNKGKYGTKILNNYFQQKLNGDAPAITLVFEDDNGQKESFVFRKGDKIIWTKNDYKLNLYNGMIGYIENFDDDGNFSLEFEDKTVIVPPVLETYNPNTGKFIFSYDPRKNMQLAYAITTHKAQGSEFKRVVLVLTKSYIMERSNFYTAVTRARDTVDVVCGIGGIAAAMRKKSPASAK